MRNYHVTLTDGSERNVKAKLVTISANGALQFFNDAGKDGSYADLVCAYASGTWAAVEVERLDDKG